MPDTARSVHAAADLKNLQQLVYLRWTAVFGSAGDEPVPGVTLSDDGHVVVVGTTSGTVAATPIAGGTDGFAVAFPVGSSGGGGAASSA